MDRLKLLTYSGRNPFGAWHALLTDHADDVSTGAVVTHQDFRATVPLHAVSAAVWTAICHILVSLLRPHLFDLPENLVKYSRLETLEGFDFYIILSEKIHCLPDGISFHVYDLLDTCVLYVSSALKAGKRIHVKCASISTSPSQAQNSAFLSMDGRTEFDAATWKELKFEITPTAQSLIRTPVADIRRFNLVMEVVPVVVGIRPAAG